MGRDSWRCYISGTTLCCSCPSQTLKSRQICRPPAHPVDALQWDISTQERSVAGKLLPEMCLCGVGHWHPLPFPLLIPLLSPQIWIWPGSPSQARPGWGRSCSRAAACTSECLYVGWGLHWGLGTVPHLAPLPPLLSVTLTSGYSSWEALLGTSLPHPNRLLENHLVHRCYLDIRN